MQDAVSSHRFITLVLQAMFPACRILAEARSRGGGQLSARGVHSGRDRGWLKPRRNIPQRLFSMVVCWFVAPDAADCGTDLHDASLTW
jgi:hypothetical protein